MYLDGIFQDRLQHHDMITVHFVLETTPNVCVCVCGGGGGGGGAAHAT